MIVDRTGSGNFRALERQKASAKVPGHQDDDRPALVVGMEWVSKITTVSFEMVLPAALGHWLDSKWGTSPWLVVLGAFLGFFTAMRHLMLMVSHTDNKNQANRPGKQQ